MCSLGPTVSILASRTKNIISVKITRYLIAFPMGILKAVSPSCFVGVALDMHLHTSALPLQSRSGQGTEKRSLESSSCVQEQTLPW